MEEGGPQAARPYMQLLGPGGPGPGMWGSSISLLLSASSTRAVLGPCWGPVWLPQREGGKGHTHTLSLGSLGSHFLGLRKSRFPSNGPISFLALHRLVVSPPPCAFLSSTVQALAKEFPLYWFLPSTSPQSGGAQWLSPGEVGKLCSCRPWD